MAEFSGFFDAHLTNGKYDRTYLAEHFAKYFSSFIGNGVFGGKSNELIVRQKEVADMSIRVLEGQAFINGYFYENDSELSLSIDIADGVLNRIDLIVLRLDNTERTIRLAVKKGKSETNAVAPILQRDADYYELGIAEVYINAGATSITQANITDKRLDKNMCGFVHNAVQQFDTTDFGIQLESFIRNFETYNTTKMNEVLARLNAMADDNDLASLIIDVKNLEAANESIKSEVAETNQTLGYTKKNLLPYPYNTYPGMISLRNGVEWFDNGDGTLTVLGTADSNNSYYTLYEGEFPKWLKPGRYLLSAGNEHTSACYVFFVKIKKGTTAEYSGRVKSLDKTEIVITEQDIADYNILISGFVESGKTVSRVKLSPMIRKAEDSDETWEPFRHSVDEMYHEDEVEKGCFYRFNNATKTKEWINPPLRYGVEYCLTERWNTKPVYQQTFYLSTLPNKAMASLGIGVNWDKIISVNAYALDSDDLTYYPFPITLSNQVAPIAVISSVSSDGYLTITTNVDASHFKAYVTIKYIK